MMAAASEDASTPTLLASQNSSSSNSKRKKNKRKRKKNSGSNVTSDDNSIATSQSHNHNQTTASSSNDKISSSSNTSTSILQSNISLKKRLYLKKNARQTPWYDVDELLETGRGLLLALKLFPPGRGCGARRPSPHDGISHEERARLRSALGRVAVWRGRSDRGGRLPHAVDVTAGLAEVLLLDANRASVVAASNGSDAAATTTATPSPHQLRNAYSASLLRSVNGLADTYRHQKRSAALSVSHCCMLAGLPAWIVDVRHDASHNELPSLGVCRIAALESLRFWGGRYWDDLEEGVYGLGGGGSTETEGRDAGIRTMAFDCLGRYERAATMESFERKKSQQQRRTRENEERQRKQQAGGPNKIKNNEDATTAPKGNAKTQTEQVKKEKIPTPVESDGKAKLAKESSKSKGSANPWAILSDNKPKKKKKKTKIENSTGANAGGASLGVATPTEGRKEDGGKLSVVAPTPADVPSSRDCAAEFVRTIPMDVAFSTALRFLVWGGTGASPSQGADRSAENDNSGESGVASAAGDAKNGPALLTLPPEEDSLTRSRPKEQFASSAKQKLDASFEQLRAKYDWLLIAMTNAYPGFLVSLFVHLTDSLLCLDAALHQNQMGNGDATENCNGNLDLDKLGRNVHHLSRWMRYILSREYHMHFDRSVAMYDEPILQPRPLDRVESEQNETTQAAVDLKKKGKKKWTPVELEYMESPLEFPTLRQNGFPLNSVCDRLHLHQLDFPTVCFGGSNKVSSNPSSAVGSLRQLLEDVVGEERVPFMGIYNRDGIEVFSDGDDQMKGASLAETEEKASDDDMDEVTPEGKSDTLQRVPDRTAESFSLEDMESMLENADAKTHTAIASVGPPGEEGEVPCMESCSKNAPIRHIIKPWTLCTSWDACAVGAMPGYPV